MQADNNNNHTNKSISHTNNSRTTIISLGNNNPIVLQPLDRGTLLRWHNQEVMVRNIKFLKVSKGSLLLLQTESLLLIVLPKQVVLSAKGLQRTTALQWVAYCKDKNQEAVQLAQLDVQSRILPLIQISHNNSKKWCSVLNQRQPFVTKWPHPCQEEVTNNQMLLTIRIRLEL